MFSLVESPRGQARSLLIDKVIGAAGQNFMRGGNYFWVGGLGAPCGVPAAQSNGCILFCHMQGSARRPRIATGLGAYARQA